MIGSVNLTGGLVNNVEIGTWLRGRVDDEPIARAWSWAQDRWASQQTVAWLPVAGSLAPAPPMPAELLSALQVQVAVDPEFRTLGPQPRVNVVTDLTPDGLYVQTGRSLDRAAGPQLVPGWMFELAWSYLLTHGELSNTTLLNDLRVHRSSAVCAILARLPGVEVVPGRDIRLRWQGRADSGLR